MSEINNISQLLDGNKTVGAAGIHFENLITSLS